MTNRLSGLSVLLPAFSLGLAATAFSAEGRVPVVLDTDIGDDIDDTWALAMILKSPQLDLKMVTTTFGKAEYRAKIVAKLLTVANRTDVAVALGEGGRTGSANQQPWVQDYKLTDYPGKVHENAVAALTELLEQSPQPITVIAIGPCNTLSALLEKRPDLAGKANFAGMHGSVYKGYNGGPVSPEWNVKAVIPAAHRVLSGAWRQMVITPLDTCGLVNLSGERFKALKACPDPLVKAMLENYRIWAKKATLEEIQGSSTLFDCVAVYLAYPDEHALLEIENLSITVTDKGVTAIDPAGTKMGVAARWKSLDGFRDLLVKVLTRP